MAYEWMGDVVIGIVAKFGLPALAAFLMVVGSMIAVALYCYATLCARNSKAGFVAAVLVSAFAIANFNLRPQMFGALFLALTLIILELFRQGRTRFLWVLPPMFLLWVNTHGSWIVGIAAILVILLGGLFEFRLGSVEGIRWSEKRRIQLELALLGSISVIPLTPYGTKLATYPFLVASSLPLNVGLVEEWLPMPFNSFWGHVFLILLVGAFLFQMVYRPSFRLEQWVLAFFGIVMASIHVRFVLFFAPFFAPILSTMLARWLDPYRVKKDKFVLNAALMAVAIFATVWYFPSRSELERDVERQFPVRAVKFLRAHSIKGPMFNTYGAGGYLVAYYPEQRVFIDGRGDLYELGGVMADFVQVITLKPAALSILNAYGIQVCLLERGEPLAVVLAENPEWKTIYYDDTNIIFVRDYTPNRTSHRENGHDAAD